MFNDKYLDSLPDDPLLAVSKVVDRTLDYWGNLHPEAEAEEYDVFLEAFAIIQALASNTDDVSVEAPILVGPPDEIVRLIVGYCNEVKESIVDHLVSLKMAQFNNKYKAKYANIFSYEFTEGDLTKIQKLLNELRDIISGSELFEEDHKSRLLSRLEKVQEELHKKMADLDRLWGLVGDAGVAIGKFGKDAKPIVDRIREISDIAWRTQSRAEELPSDTPMEMLDHSGDDDQGCNEIQSQ